MAAITHDLRSPLTTVMGYTDLIQKTNLDEKQKHYLTQIKKSSQFILRLVNDLLDLSKLEAGKMLVEKLSFNPKKLLKDTVNNIIPAEKNKDVKIIIEVSDETNVQIESDPFRIKQILANLISNAWKFTEKGSILIAAELQEKTGENHILEIRVKDSGIGISREMQANIFEEFSQEDSSIEKRFGGSGLGLAITKRLTELLDGKIKVESEQGKGSEFIISIPVVKLSETREEVEREENTEDTTDETHFASKGMRALIVDDEPGQLSLTVEVAKSMGFEIETAENGKQALEKLKNFNFDIVLTDIQMPIADGFELIKTIRNNEKFKGIPVIALSGRTDIPINIYKQAGFQNKLLKPYKSKDLKRNISELLDLKHEETEMPEAMENGKLKSENYDLSDIYEFSGHDDDAMQTIMQAFLEGATSSTKELEAAFKEKNSDKMGKLAHRMLPMLRQMKANEVIAVLVKMEARDEVSPSEFAYFQRKIKELISSLEEAITV